MDHRCREGFKITEFGDIPIEWDIQNLCMLSEKIGDGLHGTPIYQEDGEYYFINGNNLNNGKIQFTSDTKKVNKFEYNKYKKELSNRTLLLSLNGTIGNLAYYNYEKVVLSKSTGYVTLNDMVNKEYIYYSLSSSKVQSFFLQELTGTTIKNLSLDTLRRTPIVLPTLKEQKKIADILSTVDEQIEQVDTLIEKTKELKKGLMQRLLKKGIGHTEFKQTEVGEIPVEWDTVRLIDLADKLDKHSFTGGPFGSDLKSCHYTESGIRIIQLQNIGDGYFDGAYAIHTSEEKANELKNCNIYPGEIIIAKMADPVARACKVPNEEKRYLMCSDGIRLSVDKNLYDGDYVMYAINSSYFRKNAIANSTGSTRLRIGLSELKNLPIVIPPLSEQRRIAAMLLTMDKKITEFEKKRESLRYLKQALMQKLLTGKIRVRQ